LSYLAFIPIQAQSSRFDFQYPSLLVYIITASTSESGIDTETIFFFPNSISAPIQIRSHKKNATGSETYLERATAHGGHPTCIASALRYDLPEIQTQIKGINQSATKLKSINTSDEERINRKRVNLTRFFLARSRGIEAGAEAMAS
jgi:hypothetical protein